MADLTVEMVENILNKQLKAFKSLLDEKFGRVEDSQKATLTLLTTKICVAQATANEAKQIALSVKKKTDESTVGILESVWEIKFKFAGFIIAITTISSAIGAGIVIIMG